MACVWEGVVGARKGTLCLTVSLSTAGSTPTANLFEIAFVADVIVPEMVRYNHDFHSMHIVLGIKSRDDKAFSRIYVGGMQILCLFI